MSPLQSLLLFLSIILLFSLVVSEQKGDFQTLNTKFNPKIPLPPLRTLSSSKRFEGSSDLVKLKYHMGPVLSSPINIYLIWYGNWARPHKQLIKHFLLSISDTTAPHPFVSYLKLHKQIPSTSHKVLRASSLLRPPASVSATYTEAIELADVDWDNLGFGSIYLLYVFHKMWSRWNIIKW